MCFATTDCRTKVFWRVSSRKVVLAGNCPQEQDSLLVSLDTTGQGHEGKEGDIIRLR